MYAIIINTAIAIADTGIYHTFEAICRKFANP